MACLKKKMVGLNTGKYIGISFTHNFRCDPNFEIGNICINFKTI